VNEDGIDWNLQPIMKRNKPVYVISRDSLEYFSSRIIQQRIKSDYNLLLLSRNSIIDGIKENLADCLPKSIIRTDIVEFYERIDRSKLVDILSFDGLLPIDQLIAIKRLFYNFQFLTSKGIGLPRGNGISAYLSEVLLKTFDIFAKNLDEVIYYARFVDDIIVIVKEEEINTTKNADKVWEKLNIKIAELSLQLHPIGLKTTIGYTNSGCSFDYLGYKFSVNNNHVNIGISGSKISRYKKKISLAFWDFYKDRDSSIGVKTTLLRNRLRYLTLVTMLSGMKSGIKVGLPATYLNLTDFSGLDELDKFLNKQKMKLPVSCLARLNDCNFRNGYESMKSTHFRVNDLKQMLCIWSGV
jgi:hypothetical protein